MLTVSRTFTDADLEAIAHSVVDPLEWANHAFAEVGANAITAKVEKYRADYEAAKTKYGADYKNRAQRDAEEKANSELK